MELIFLFVILALEIGFSVYCFISRSNQIRTRKMFRLSLLLIFVVLVATSLLKWSIKWYGVMLLLLVLAVISLVQLLKKEAPSDKFSKGKLIWNTIGVAFVWFVAFLPALIFPQHAVIQPTGRYQVATGLYTYIDPARNETYSDKGENRRVTVEFWYPTDVNGKYPLVLFSHGSFGVITSNLSLYNELASHGYVVASVSHPYQSLYTTDENGKTILIDSGFMNEIASEDAKTDKQKSFELYQKWMGIRMGDINFVIDTILDKANSSSKDVVYNLVDPTKIGVMGHSLGGSAALGIGETRKEVSAVLALEAPFMNDVVGVKNGEFVWNDKAYPVSVLNIYSDSSWSHLSEWPQYAMNDRLIKDSIPNYYSVYVQGARHLNLTDLALTSPFLTSVLNGQKASVNARECLIIINQLALGFFDHTLKGESEFAPKGIY